MLFLFAVSKNLHKRLVVDRHSRVEVERGKLGVRDGRDNKRDTLALQRTTTITQIMFI